MISQSQRIICLEFNELVPELIDRFISEGQLPNFQKLRDQSLQMITDANASGEWLNPWVQWVTVHSGLEASEHKIFRLSNASQLETPAVWDHLSDAGKKIWVCGSMNPWSTRTRSTQQPLNGHLLPDPWSYQISPFPAAEFEPFYQFVRRQVQDHTSDAPALKRTELSRCLKFLLSHGFSFSTAASILSQLLKERFEQSRWKRATLLDVIQFDIFKWYYQKHQPHFATFFSNATAHYQHRFWRNMDPELFQIQPDADDQRRYKNAILFGYQQLDKIVGRVMKLDPQATIMLMTGLGQQPYLEREAQGGKRHTRLKSEKVLTRKLGVQGAFEYEPIMADEFFLRFSSGREALACADRLQLFALPNGESALTATVEDDSVICQCRSREKFPNDAVLTNRETNETIPFYEVFHLVDSLKSGWHHPDGVWWISNPGAKHLNGKRTEKVNLSAITPTILDLMGVQIPQNLAHRSLFAPPQPDQTTPSNRELVSV